MTERMTPNASGSCCEGNQHAGGKTKRNKMKTSAKKRDVSLKKERGHLFVPSCVAKSLTEAVLNDIGESLQSEELQGARGRREKKRIKSDEEVSTLRERRKKVRHTPLVLVHKQLSHASSASLNPEGTRGCVTVSSLSSCIRAIRVCLCSCRPRHMTHRARYVRAGCPLAVGPGRRRTSDFLLLPQQLAVLLLSVLHVDQQRDEAVLHLFLLNTGPSRCLVFALDAQREKSIFICR